ncbi:MAG: hypothetical protein R3F31_17930 [Verrucomicrobiales bacterium]
MLGSADFDPLATCHLVIEFVGEAPVIRSATNASAATWLVDSRDAFRAFGA